MNEAPNPDSQHESKDSYIERIGMRVHEYLNEVTDNFTDGIHNDRVYSLYELGASEGLMRFQPVRHNVNKTVNAIGPAEEVVTQIVEITTANLNTDFPGTHWEDVVAVEKNGGSIAILVDLTKTQ